MAPVSHELAPLLQEIGSAVGGLNFIRDRMRQGGLRHLSRVARLISDPIAESRPKAVHGNSDIHIPKDLEESHVRHWLFQLLPWKYEVAAGGSELFSPLEDFDCLGREGHDMRWISGLCLSSFGTRQSRSVLIARQRISQACVSKQD